MSTGYEGELTLTVKARVSPEPESQQALLDFMKRYREALNYSIRVIIANKALSLNKAHKLLYNELTGRYGLPGRCAEACYRQAIAIAKSWLKNPDKGDKLPILKKLSIWLDIKCYRVKDSHVELIGGFRFRIIGWDRRFDGYPNKEARLVYNEKEGKFTLYVAKRIPRPAKYKPKGVLAVDINERYIVIGNSDGEIRVKTQIDRAFHFVALAENMKRKYSYSKYNPWLSRSGIRKRIGHFYKKANNIMEDWVRKLSYAIVVHIAKKNQLAVAREDLTGLINRLRRLPKNHKVALIWLGYGRLGFWLDWQAEKNGVPIVVIDPVGTSTTCPRCGAKLVEVGHRKLRCPVCGFEGDRDTIAVLNIEKRALSKMGSDGGSFGPPDCPPDDRCKPE